MYLIFSIIISLQEIISPLAEAAGMIRPGSTSIIRMRFTGLRRTEAESVFLDRCGDFELRPGCAGFFGWKAGLYDRDHRYSGSGCAGEGRRKLCVGIRRSVPADISETVCSRGISVTGSVVVNGYGRHQDEADNFAAWLCTDSADKLFDRSTLVPAKKSAAQQTEEMAAFWQEYSQTVPVPKLRRLRLLGTDGDRGDENLGGRKRFGRFKRPSKKSGHR